MLIEAIYEVAQIYRFDDFRISICSDNKFFEFEVPSTEWLEEFTAVLTDDQTRDVNYVLHGSGYRFHVLRTNSEMMLFVYDLRQQEQVEVRLTLNEARMLHRCVINCILEPFIKQGGSLRRLADLNRFCIGKADPGNAVSS